jgi:hypothetical protein
LNAFIGHFVFRHSKTELVNFVTASLDRIIQKKIIFMTLMYKMVQPSDRLKTGQIVWFSNGLAAILFSPFENWTGSLFPASQTVVYKNILFMRLLCLKWSSLVTIQKPDISVRTTIYWSGSTKLDCYVQKGPKKNFLLYKTV